MMHRLCRLCSCNKNVVDVFDPNLKRRRLLRYCILLASGIVIKKEDNISTMVCYGCAEYVVKQHRYRINAISNDKLLKEKCGQSYSPPIMDPKKLMKAALVVDQMVNSSELLRTHVYNGGNNSNTTSKPQKNTPLNTFAILSNNNSVEKPNSTCDIVKVRTNSLHINKHPSITKILSEYKSLKVPEEVFHNNMLPLVALNKNDVEQWFINHPATSMNTVDDAINESLTICSDVSSDDGDQILRSHRLRKRTNRRIIIDSESEDEPCDNRKMRKTMSFAANDSSNVFASDQIPTVAVRTESNLGEPTLRSIFNDFNRYGINFENSEPPIEIGNRDNAICVKDDAIATDNNSIAIEDNAIAIDDDSNDVILVSDDHANVNINRNTTNTLNESPVMDSNLKWIFEHHYYDYVPSNIAILRTTTGTITLQNMVNEIKMYAIPVELERSTKPRCQAIFSKTSPKVSNGSKNITLWNGDGCVDIVVPRDTAASISPALSNEKLIEQSINNKIKSLLKEKQLITPVTKQLSITNNIILLNTGNLNNVSPSNLNNVVEKLTQPTKTVYSSVGQNATLSLNQKQQLTTPTSMKSATLSNNMPTLNNGNMCNTKPITQINLIEKPAQSAKTAISSKVQNNEQTKSLLKKVVVPSLKQTLTTTPTFKPISPKNTLIHLNNGSVYNVMPVSQSNGNNANVNRGMSVNQTNAIEKPSQPAKILYSSIVSNQTIANPPVNKIISAPPINQNTPVSTQLTSNRIERNNGNDCNLVPIHQTNVNNASLYTVVSVNQTNTNNTSVYSAVQNTQSTANTGVYNVVPVNQTNANNRTVYVPVNQTYSNNTNMYNVIPVNPTNTNTTNVYNMVSVSDKSVTKTITNEDMPPLIPITASLNNPVPVTSNHTIPLTLNTQTNVNNPSALEIRLHHTDGLDTSNKIIADSSKVQSSTSIIVPEQSKTFDWHKVQNLDPSEDITRHPPIPLVEKQAVISQQISTQNGVQRTGVIRVKNLSDLLKS